MQAVILAAGFGSRLKSVSGGKAKPLLEVGGRPLILHQLETLADEDLRVSTEAAYTMVRRLAREEGLMVGVSSGAALAATLDVASRIREGVLVTVFPDGAEKYLSEKFWTADE